MFIRNGPNAAIKRCGFRPRSCCCCLQPRVLRQCRPRSARAHREPYTHPRRPIQLFAVALRVDFFTCTQVVPGHPENVAIPEICYDAPDFRLQLELLVFSLGLGDTAIADLVRPASQPDRVCSGAVPPHAAAPRRPAPQAAVLGNLPKVCASGVVNVCTKDAEAVITIDPISGVTINRTTLDLSFGDGTVADGTTPSCIRLPKVALPPLLGGRSRATGWVGPPPPISPSIPLRYPTPVSPSGIPL